MLVADVHFKCVWTGQSGRRLWRLQFDEERGYICKSLSPSLGGGDGEMVPDEPQVAIGIVARREIAAGLRPPHHADHLDAVGGIMGCASARIFVILRHETAVDGDEIPVRKTRQRKHPVARSGHLAAPGRTDGIDTRLRAGNERSREPHSPEFVVGPVKPCPQPARRQ